MDTIPVIDISSFRDHSNETHPARAISEACEGIGFFIVTGHGVAPEILQHLIDESRLFFDRPTAEKTMIKRHGDCFGGPTYVPLNSESLGALAGQAGQADLKESLDVAPRFQGDRWCAGTDALQAAWVTGHAALSELAADLRALFCVAAGLPRDALEPAFARHASSIRSLNYPEVRGGLKAGEVRAGEHTDYGAFTMIRGDDAPGLQARARTGEWVDVPAVPGSFVVNIGDLLMRWTDDKWISTPHRVICPADTPISPRRQSIAFFHNPGADAVIDCLEPFRQKGIAPKYPPVVYKSYAQDRFRAQIGDPKLELPISVE